LLASRRLTPPHRGSNSKHWATHTNSTTNRTSPLLLSCPWSSPFVLLPLLSRVVGLLATRAILTRLAPTIRQSTLLHTTTSHPNSSPLLPPSSPSLLPTSPTSPTPPTSTTSYSAFCDAYRLVRQDAGGAGGGELEDPQKESREGKRDQGSREGRERRVVTPPCKRGKGIQKDCTKPCDIYKAGSWIACAPHKSEVRYSLASFSCLTRTWTDYQVFLLLCRKTRVLRQG
jgi:hypothetical protein